MPGPQPIETALLLRVRPLFVFAHDNSSIVPAEAKGVADCCAYFTLLSFRPEEEIERLRGEVEQGRNPKEAKVLLAREITARFHGASAADAAEADFELRARGGVPEAIPELVLAGAPMGVGALLKQAGLAPSTSEALRLVDQGGVRVDGDTVTDRGLKLGAGRYVVQVGKRRFARVTLS